MLALAGLGLLAPTWGGPPVAHEPMAIVQGNVPLLGLDFNAQRRAVLDNHVAGDRGAGGAEVAAGSQPQPVAVIWPENSSDVDPLRAVDAGAQIDQAADAIGAPILVGAVLQNPADPAHRAQRVSGVGSADRTGGALREAPSGARSASTCRSAASSPASSPVSTGSRATSRPAAKPACCSWDRCGPAS